jgi:hypothetical protein
MVYEPGRLYAVTAETARAVAAGNATFVDASAALVPRKTGGREIYELVEPVDRAAALRALLEQQRADAAAQAAAIAAAEQQLAALEAGG